MKRVISSFGFNGAEGDEHLMYVTIADQDLISEKIPMSHEHFELIKNAITRAHDIGVDNTAQLTKDAISSVLDFNKPYL